MMEDAIDSWNMVIGGVEGVLGEFHINRYNHLLKELAPYLEREVKENESNS